MSNPYVSPIPEPPSDEGKKDAATQGDATLGSLAKTTFIAWEKLRVLYVGILFALTVLLALGNISETFDSISFWGMAIGGAVVVNLCFFAGPIIETYVRWLGYRGQALRWSVFCLGTVFSCLLVLAAMARFLLPGPV